MTNDIRNRIRTIPDYPKPGIMFRDVTTLWNDARGFRTAIDLLVQPYAGVRIDKVAGIEARGFVIGGAVAHQLSVGFIPIRKQNKLPGKTIGEDYDLEYGTDRVEIHDDAISEGQNVLIVDDLPHARRYLRMILEATGLACVEAEDGQSALGHADTGIDLVITDLKMPGLNGYSLIERIQGGALGLPPPRIVVCSADAGEEAVRSQVMGMGCAGVIPKPYLPVEVNSLIMTLR